MMDDGARRDNPFVPKKLDRLNMEMLRKTCREHLDTLSSLSIKTSSQCHVMRDQIKNALRAIEAELKRRKLEGQ